MTIVGSETKQRRVQVGLTQGRLAELVGIPRGTLALHESRGRRLNRDAELRLDAKLSELVAHHRAVQTSKKTENSRPAVTPKRSIEETIADAVCAGVQAIREDERNRIRSRLGL